MFDHVYFEISGPDAPLLADELADLIEQQFGRKPVRESLESEPAEGTVRGLAEMLSVISLVLAIPGGIDAPANQSQRARTADRVRRLIDWAKQRSGRRNHIHAKTAKGHQPLDEAEPELIELLNRLTHDDGP
jgi:hypothetical protein